MTIILGLESSCDETAAALVTDDRRVLAHRVAGQEAQHQPFGGVVPEIAARAHAVSGIVDRIGGGDAFAAGLLHGLNSGYPDDKTLDFALAAACLKHYIPGDFNLSTVADVEFYLSDSGSDVRR